MDSLLLHWCFWGAAINLCEMHFGLFNGMCAPHWAASCPPHRNKGFLTFSMEEAQSSLMHHSCYLPAQKETEIVQLVSIIFSEWICLFWTSLSPLIHCPPRKWVQRGSFRLEDRFYSSGKLEEGRFRKGSFWKWWPKGEWPCLTAVTSLIFPTEGCLQ